jgi:hypothetical protein
MRSDIVPGGKFPEYALPVQTNTIRHSSEQRHNVWPLLDVREQRPTGSTTHSPSPRPSQATAWCGIR